MSSLNQHWTILGAGAVGHLLAYGFAQSNIPATLVFRNQIPQPESLLEYHSNNSEKPYSVSYATLDYLPKVTHLLLTVKSWQVEEAIRSVKHLLTVESHIFLLQNGMGILEKVTDLLSNILPPEQIFPGVNTHGCHLHKDNSDKNKLTLVHAGFGNVTFGNNYNYSSSTMPPEGFLELQQLPLNIKWSSEIELKLWMKLAINAAINPVTAINNCNNGALSQSTELTNQVKLLCLETAKLFEKLDLNIDQETITTAVFDVIQLTAENKSSMLQDITSGKNSEIKAITGYLLKKSKMLDIELELHQYYYNQIRSLQEI